MSKPKAYTVQPALDIDYKAMSVYLRQLDPDAGYHLFSFRDDDKARYKLDQETVKAAKGSGDVPWDDLDGPFHATFRFSGDIDDPASMSRGRGKKKTLASTIEWKQGAGAGVFVTINAFSRTEGTGRKTENFDYTRCVHAEDDTQTKDGKPRRDFPLAWSFAVESSAGRFHYYWLTRATGPQLTYDQTQGINRAIADMFGTDQAAKDVNRILRVPGTWNLKPGREPFQVRLIEGDGDEVADYTPAQLLEAFPPVMTPMRKGGGRRPLDPGAPLPDDADVVRSALEAIRDRCEGGYHDWLQIGMALHGWSAGSLDALEMWQTICPDPDECESKWASFRADGGLGAGTIMHHAAEAGWTEEKGREAALDAWRDALKRLDRGDPVSGKPRPTQPLDGMADALSQSAEFMAMVARIAAMPGLDTLTEEQLLQSLRQRVGAPTMAALKRTLKDAKRARIEQAKADAGGDGFVFPDQTETGMPMAQSLVNVVEWLRAADADIWHNELAGIPYVGKQPMDDALLHRFHLAIHGAKMFAHVKLVEAGVAALAFENRRHPVQEYILDVAQRFDADDHPDSLLNTWLVRSCHLPDVPHWRAAGRLWMIALVMRQWHPGAKFDCTPALLGPEGMGKSKFCRVLALRDEWCLEGFTYGEKKQIVEEADGKIIVEYGEMAGHSRRDTAAQKDAMSRRFDKARKAYDRYATERGRSWLAIATSNEIEVLISQTGNRRWWPVRITQHIDIKWLLEVRDQLFAEARHAMLDHLEATGDTEVALPKEHWEAFGALQEEHREHSIEEDIVADMFDKIESGHVLTTTVAEAVGTKMRAGRSMKVLEHAMAQLGWTKTKARLGDSNGPRNYFIKGEDHAGKQVVWVIGDGGEFGMEARNVKRCDNRTRDSRVTDMRDYRRNDDNRPKRK